VVVGGTGAVLVYVVAVIVEAGRVAGVAGVLEGSAYADHLTCCCTYTQAAAGRGRYVFVIGNAVAVVIYAIAV
jgi:hypothetical protein